MLRSIVTLAVLLAATGVGGVAQARDSSSNCLPPAVSHAMMTAGRGQHIKLPANWVHQHLQIGHCSISIGQFTTAMGGQMGTGQYQMLGRIIER